MNVVYTYGLHALYTLLENLKQHYNLLLILKKNNGIALEIENSKHPKKGQHTIDLLIVHT
jgi:hypothetical protein